MRLRLLGEPDGGGSPYLKRGDIAKRIVTRAGTVLDPSQVNSAALTALNSAKPDACTFYWNRPITKAEALSEVMQGCLGFWFCNLSGELVLGYLSAPGSSPVASYRFGDQTGEPTHTDKWQAVRWKTTVG